MLNFQNKYLFIEIPRTGTTTIRDSFVGMYEEFNDPRHITLSGYLKIFPSFEELATFTFVRNTFDRFASLYEHTKHFNATAKECQSFENFVDWFIFPNNIKLTNDDIRITMCDMLQVNNEINIDWVGKFENYPKYFKDFCSFMHLPHTKSLHSNKFKHTPYKQYYNADTKQKIASYFEKDLDYFKYTF